MIYGHSVNPAGRPPVAHVIEAPSPLSPTVWLCGSKCTTVPQLADAWPEGVKRCQICDVYDRTGGRRPVLYVVELAGGCIKVGRTTQLGHRLLGLRSPRLIAYGDGGPADESRLVARLADVDPDHGAEEFHPDSLDTILAHFAEITSIETESVAS